jgi:hypothetical protein
MNAGSSTSCTAYLQRFVLPLLDRPLVLAFDDLDRVFTASSVCQDFLALLRSWIELSKTDPLLGKLRFVFVHATDIYATLNLNQSPLNVGMVAQLLPMRVDQVQHLALLHGLNWIDSDEATILHYHFAGQPQAIRKALYYLSHHPVTLDEFLREVVLTGGIFRNQFQHILEMLQLNSSFAKAIYAAVRSLQPITVDPLVGYALESLGAVTFEDGRISLSLPVFRDYILAQTSRD